MYPTLESRADIVKMLDEMTQARKSILEKCRSLTENQLQDPVYPGTWTLLQNLAHLAWAEAYMLAWIQKRPGTLPREEFPPQVPPDLPSIEKALDESHAAIIAFVKANDETVLKERCLFSKYGDQTVGGVFFHVIEHEIHHRAFILHKLGKVQGK